MSQLICQNMAVLLYKIARKISIYTKIRDSIVPFLQIWGLLPIFLFLELFLNIYALTNKVAVLQSHHHHII